MKIKAKFKTTFKNFEIINTSNKVVKMIDKLNLNLFRKTVLKLLIFAFKTIKIKTFSVLFI